MMRGMIMFWRLLLGEFEREGMKRVGALSFKCLTCHQSFLDGLIEHSRDEEANRRHTITITTGTRREGRSRSPYNSSSPSRHGTVTPPPNTRNKRTSTPPGYASAPSIVRTNSHRSKSSSDGSWDTPTASPPGSNNRPPHARHTASNVRRGSGKGEAAQDVSEAVYTKFWMCGFTDAFNFDNLKKP